MMNYLRRFVLVCFLSFVVATSLAGDEEVPAHHLRARQFYEDCQNEDPGACGNLGALFADGELSNGKPNYERAYFYYHRACDLGDASRCVRAATFAAKGQGTTLSKEKAIEILTRGCDIKEGESCNNLALLKIGAQFLDGSLVKDKAQEIPEYVKYLFERGCDYGSKSACKNIHKIKARKKKK